MNQPAMAVEWAARGAMGRTRRARMVPDGSVPGLWWPAPATPTPGTPRAPRTLTGAHSAPTTTEETHA